MNNEDVVMLSAEDFTVKKQTVQHRKSFYFRVDEYTLDGEFIRTWDSMQEAGDVLGITKYSIGNCVKGYQLTIPKIDRIFLREGDNIKKRLKAIEKHSQRPIGKAYAVPIREYNLKGKLVAVYPSISVAAYITNVPNCTVAHIDKGVRLCTDDGRIFLREGNSIKARLELIRQRNYNQSMNKSIDMYSNKGTLNGHFRNAVEVAERFGISVMSVLDNCLGVTKTCKGNIFLFSGDSIEERLKLKNNKK